MLSVSDLPHVQALLNGITTILLIAGFILIKNQRPGAHMKVMLSAAFVSVLFLVSYITYHIHSPINVFKGTGVISYVYYFILITHVILATAAVPMVALTLFRALTGRFEKHRKIARWTWPVWIYVSISGVIVYYMLYVLSFEATATAGAA